MKKYLKTVTSPSNLSQLPAPLPKKYFSKQQKGHDPSFSDLKIYQDIEIIEKPNTEEMSKALQNQALNLNTAGYLYFAYINHDCFCYFNHKLSDKRKTTNFADVYENFAPFHKF